MDIEATAAALKNLKGFRVRNLNIIYFRVNKKCNKQPSLLLSASFQQRKNKRNYINHLNLLIQMEMERFLSKSFLKDISLCILKWMLKLLSSKLKKFLKKLISITVVS